MANYICAYRTNYFRVTDENKYAELFQRLSGEDLVDFSKTTDDGKTILHGFGGYGGLSYAEGDDDDAGGIDEFMRDLQSILPDDEAAEYIEGGNEKLRYVTGYALFVTSEEAHWIDLGSWFRDQAKGYFGKENRVTEPMY